MFGKYSFALIMENADVRKRKDVEHGTTVYG